MIKYVKGFAYIYIWKHNYTWNHFCKTD